MTKNITVFYYHNFFFEFKCEWIFFVNNSNLIAFVVKQFEIAESWKSLSIFVFIEKKVKTKMKIKIKRNLSCHSETQREREIWSSLLFYLFCSRNERHVYVNGGICGLVFANFDAIIIHIQMQQKMKRKSQRAIWWCAWHIKQCEFACCRPQKMRYSRLKIPFPMRTIILSLAFFLSYIVYIQHHRHSFTRVFM